MTKVKWGHGAVAALVLCAVFASRAEATESDMHAGELAHAVDRLGTTARVLYVAAHPDDENTRLLAYLANQRHLTVAYLSMTRGGGGQNLIGDEQGELLDVIRTEELLAARSLDGAVQRFSRMRDFGYSKTASETFEIWGHEEALSDVVRVIRAFQPDVIVTRFDERPPNHGHHTASAILAREAFTAAADPQRFPEQLKEGLQPWQPVRLMHNLAPWREGPVPADAISVDVGPYDARLGMSMGELAAHSRSQHKSQGFGVAGERGELIERFVLVAGAKPTKDLLDGVVPGWERFGEAGKAFGKAIATAAQSLDRDRPEAAAPALLEAAAALDKLPDSPRVRDTRRELERVLAQVFGLFIRATSPTPTVVPGSKVELQVEVVLRRPGPVTIRSVQFPDGTKQEPGAPLATNAKKVLKQQVAVPAGAPVSLPYWLEQPPPRGRYEVKDPALIGEPRGPAALSVRVDVALGARPVRFDVPVVHSWTDRVHGERVRPVLLVPPATVTPMREAVLSANGRPAPVVLRVRAAAEAVKGDVTLGLPKGWTSKPVSVPIELSRPGDETTVHFEVTPARDAGAVEVEPSLTVGGRRWAFREDVIDHPHIPVQLVLQPASLRLVPLSVRVPRGLVGYVPGSGDTIAGDLQHVGLGVEIIDDATLRSGNLSRYAAIVVGIRAYNSREAVRAAHPRLMRYVEDGGTVVVQYNTTSRWAPLTTPIGPFPLEISNGRITDEKAAMVPVDPKHPLLRTPNAITDADFEGWVQERGIYFAAKWDDRYVPLFKAADPGEEPQAGGTLVARHGKGRYVYTGLAFFRQLRAGVPGAYRLFINLLAPQRTK